MDELLNELYLMLEQYDVSNTLKNQLILILGNYEVTKKTTEVGFYDFDDYNNQMLAKFLMNKAVAGLTERSLQVYKSNIKFILNRIDKPINIITADDIKIYLAKRQLQDKVSDATAENEWRCLSTFYGWMYREEIIERNPMYKVDKPKKRKKKKKAYTQMEIERMRNALVTLRDKALFEVLLSTWCRVSEIEQMDIADIEGDSMTVLGKGKKERIVYLNSKAQLAIENYLGSRTDNNPALFVTMDKPYDRLKKSGIEICIRELGRSLGIENVHPHRFRRTGATMALRTGMPIEKVSYILGHESIETTQIYLDMSEDDVKQAHKKFVV